MDLSNLGSMFNLSWMIEKIYLFVGIFLLLAVIGGTITALLILKRRAKDQRGKSKVGWWYEVGDYMQPGEMDDVEEIVIPGTTLRIFFNDQKDLWIPRFTRAIKENLYYVLLTPTNQMVNFRLKSISNDLKTAKTEYDHTDMLWAAENSREYIKRNYKDKSVKWWQLYQNTIAVAGLILIMTFCFVLIVYFMRGIVVDMGNVANSLGNYAMQACTRAQTSGVVAA
jgi:hypothetical protein